MTKKRVRQPRLKWQIKPTTRVVKDKKKYSRQRDKRKVERNYEDS